VTAAVEESGTLPPESPVLAGDGLRLFADPENARVLAEAARDPSPAGWIRAHLSRLGPGDYLALNAFLEPSAPVVAVLQAIRESVRGSARVATTVGFGPRFLHSTGQLHKGGPPSGVFLLITADEGDPLPIPGRRLGFGELCRAQARGDQEVLSARGRRVLRVHLGGDLKAGLAALRRAAVR
jgi:transaldolase/glucose-6-phosphate isomerase